MKKKYGGLSKIPEGVLKDCAVEAQTQILLSPDMEALASARRLPTRDVLKETYMKAMHKYFSSSKKNDMGEEIPKVDFIADIPKWNIFTSLASLVRRSTRRPG